MKRLFTIGEALIDFIPEGQGVKLKDVSAFEPQVGGAPANVAATHAILGGKSHLLTQLGVDAFGDKILDMLEGAGVETEYITRTDQANTGLAFVSLDHTGNRDFSFYRNPSADLLYHCSEIDRITFDPGDILHFCSVDLVESDMKAAHETAIKKMKTTGGTVIFDPNIRLPLWEDKTAYQKTVQSFIPLANIIKVSDEELQFITGIENEKEAISTLFAGSVKAVIFTKGANGSEVILRDNTIFTHPGYTVPAVDTTGAGDAFIGAVIHKFTETYLSPYETLAGSAQEVLEFANAVGAITTMRKGAISSIPKKYEVDTFIGGLQ